MEKLSVVVPTFNEKGNVENLVSQIGDALTGIEYEIVFIDDSTDETPEILEKLSKENSHVRYEHRVGETGLATAVIRGFRIAEGDFLACMDADLQHPPAILRPMYAALRSGADFCIPSRLIPGGNDGGLNWYRKFVSGTARWIGKIALPCLRKVSDPTSGLFMFRRKCIEKADLQPVGWKIMVEVLAMSEYEKIVEIPYTFQNRESGESKLSTKVTLQYLQQVLGLMRRATKRKGIKVVRWSQKRTDAMVRRYIRGGKKNKEAGE
ncbi:MAG: polyprenol monophosphomannose synthase [Lachnospiraceae bacterium]|nr:polyprenol monophosphomannose synthase [Lachnospiraceae bacterium]